MPMPTRSREPNDWLDPFLPVFDVHERHEIPVAASAAVTWEAVQALDLRQSPLVQAVFKGREWLMGGRSTAVPPRRFLDEIRGLGWRPLRDEPGRALVMGAVTQPWVADVRFRGLPPDAFTAFAEPGFAKIAWTMVVEPLGPEASRVMTETRVATTDDESARRFRRYWRFIAPGIRLIRLRALALIRRAAERQASVAKAARRRAG